VVFIVETQDATYTVYKLTRQKMFGLVHI
jgi:hypothetical protein